jgi:bacterioferritin-associated ferredoxin
MLSFRRMILCVCNGLSERDIRAAAATCGGDTVGCVYRCLGCRVRCGKCVPYVADVARAALPNSERPAPPAAPPSGTGAAVVTVVETVEILVTAEAA